MAWTFTWLRLKMHIKKNLCDLIIPHCSSNLKFSVQKFTFLGVVTLTNWLYTVYYLNRRGLKGTWAVKDFRGPKTWKLTAFTRKLPKRIVRKVIFQFIDTDFPPYSCHCQGLKPLNEYVGLTWDFTWNHNQYMLYSSTPHRGPVHLIALSLTHTHTFVWVFFGSCCVSSPTLITVDNVFIFDFDVIIVWVLKERTKLFVRCTCI